MSDALTLPAGFYPLLGLIKDQELIAAGLHSQTDFCEHFDISLVYDYNPANDGLTDMIRWTDKRAPPSSYYHETMGIAEVNMLGLLANHTEFTPLTLGDAVAAFSVQGHRHVLELIALPEFIQHMKDVFGKRFGIFSAARDHLIAFRLTSDEEIVRWHALAEANRREFPQAYAFVLNGSDLSSLDPSRKPSLSDFVIGKDPKSVGTGSIRPPGTPEVLLSGGVRPFTREEKDELMQRAALKFKADALQKRAAQQPVDAPIQTDPIETALKLARAWLESPDGGSSTVVASKMLHMVNGPWPFYRSPQTLYLVQCQLSDGSSIAVAVAPPMDENGPLFKKFLKLSSLQKFTACVAAKGWWTCYVARRKFPQQRPDFSKLVMAMTKSGFTSFTIKDFVLLDKELLFIATAHRDGHLFHIEGSWTSNRIQPGSEADRVFDPLELFVGREFERLFQSPAS